MLVHHLGFRFELCVRRGIVGLEVELNWLSSIDCSVFLDFLLLLTHRMMNYTTLLLKEPREYIYTYTFTRQSSRRIWTSRPMHHDTINRHFTGGDLAKPMQVHKARYPEFDD